jgi:hypothetical protein
MNTFKDLNVKIEKQGFVGDKIKIDRIFNREIVVEGYKIVDSKYPEKGNPKCLHLQIILGNNRHVVFTGSMMLMDQIKQIPATSFPFKTTIVKENERFEFN